MDSTPYNKLPLYNAGSIADLRDEYNRAMQLIDKKLHQLDVQIQMNRPKGL